MSAPTLQLSNFKRTVKIKKKQVPSVIGDFFSLYHKIFKNEVEKDTITFTYINSKGEEVAIVSDVTLQKAYKEAEVHNSNKLKIYANNKTLDEIQNGLTWHVKTATAKSSMTRSDLSTSESDGKESKKETAAHTEYSASDMHLCTRCD